MFSVIISLLLGSCSTDLDSLDSYKEIPIVVGLLNPNDSIHYIRIQKAFGQNGGSAVMLATQGEQIYYADELLVTLEALDDGLLREEFVLKREDQSDHGKIKESGLFTNNPHILYSLKAELNPAFRYRVKVRNVNSGLEATAETDLVESMTVFVPDSGDILDFSDTNDLPIIYQSAKAGKVYELNARFYYEREVVLTGARTDHYIEFPMFQWEFSDNLEGGFGMSYEFPKPLFYGNIRKQLEAEEGIRYHFKSLDLNFFAAGFEFYELYQYNRVRDGIIQVVALDDYTNVENGLGIFSSRTDVVLENILLNQRSLDSLSCGRRTRHLRFAPNPAHPNYPDCY